MDSFFPPGFSTSQQNLVHLPAPSSYSEENLMIAFKYFLIDIILFDLGITTFNTIAQIIYPHMSLVKFFLLWVYSSAYFVLCVSKDLHTGPSTNTALFLLQNLLLQIISM